jgi:cation:H+ antiporter
MPLHQIITEHARRIITVGFTILITAGIFALATTTGVKGFPLWVLQILLLAGVIVLIAAGADSLVNSATRLARRLGISYLVIGLTVVAFGTSAPEMAASLVAGFQGNGDVSIANVIGSNIFNICMILGGVALLTKGGITINHQLIKRDGPLMLFATVLVFAFVGSPPVFGAASPTPSPDGPLGLLDRRLELHEGIILFAILIIYLFVLYRTGKRRSPKAVTETTPSAADYSDEKPPLGNMPIWVDGFLFMISLGLVVGGSRVLVGIPAGGEGSAEGYGALWFAGKLGMPDYVAGLTVVAAGTSAPEFVVSLVAAVKGRFDISAGNLLGSVIFNMLAVVGLVGIIIQPPLANTVIVSPDMSTSLAVLSVVLIIAVLFMWSKRRLSRFEGLVLVLLGLVYWLLDILTS